MGWRVWVVRGLVFSVLGVLTAGVALFILYTDNERVRQIVQDKLGVKFDRVGVQLASARFRLLGGVLVNELRLARCDGLDRGDFLYVPSAVLFHDKEHLLDGKVLVRRVEMERPQLRLVRHRDGRYNLTGLATPGDPRERLPTVVVRGGTLVFEDQQLAPGTNLVEIKDVHLTALNDPLPTVQVEATGRSDTLGQVRIKATFDRRTQAVEADVRLDDVPVPALLARAAVLAPEGTRHLARLTGRGEARAAVKYDGKQITYAADVAVHGGTFSHTLMHAPLQRIEVRAAFRDGAVPEAKLTATIDGAAVEAKLTGLTLPRSRHEMETPAALADALDARVDRLPVSRDGWKFLPPPLTFLAADYAPEGPISLSYSFRRGTDGSPSQVWVAKPEGMTARYHGFPYALNAITGTVRVDTSRLPQNDVTLDLVGHSGGKPVTIRGTYRGEKQSAELVLDVAGRDVKLDSRLLAALPRKAQELVEQFLPEECRAAGGLDRHPMGLADFHAHVVRRAGSPEYDKTVRVRFHGVRARYNEFPYPLEDVSGLLVVYPDHWEALDFRGRHDGGEILVEGRSTRLPDRPVAAVLEGGGGRRERVKLAVQGNNIRLGPEFERALVPDTASAKGGAAERKRMQEAWQKLSLTGRFDFKAVIVDDPDQAADVDFRIELNQCRMKPAFFAYELGDVSGSVRYTQGNIFLDKIRAKHGGTPVGLRWGLIQPRGEGRVMAWLDGIHATKLYVDADLLRAMPEGLAKACRSLKVGPAVDLSIDLRLETAGAGAAPKVWWDGGVGLANCSLRTGVDLEGVHGQFFTKGHYDGRSLCGMNGQLSIREAKAFGQPLSAITARMQVPAGTPDVLQVRDLKGTVFGGTVGGQAHLKLGPRPEYHVNLVAVGIDLASVGKHNLSAPGHHLEGKVQTSLVLQGEGDDLHGMRGSGRIDVASGKMGELPVILDMLKALGLRKPDGIAFEQAHATFTLAGPRVHVSLLDLYGAAVSLRGSGGLDLDGSDVALDFAATFGRIDEWMPFGLDRLPRLLSSQLLKLKMRGKLGKDQQIRFDKELVPGVLEPIRRITRP
ncbi:MAG: AsmA-like C-terminal region-containing protein [Gemmataceae bacterium]